MKEFDTGEIARKEPVGHVRALHALGRVLHAVVREPAPRVRVSS